MRPDGVYRIPYGLNNIGKLRCCKVKFLGPVLHLVLLPDVDSSRVVWRSHMLSFGWRYVPCKRFTIQLHYSALGFSYRENSGRGWSAL